MSGKRKRASLDVSEVEEELQCPICQELYTDPRTLPCGNGHDLCLECARACPRNRRGGLDCPMCREPCRLPRGVDGLPVNRLLRSMVDKVKAAQDQADAIDKLLREAAGAGDGRRVKELLEQGAQVDAKDDDGQTPLHLASENGHIESMRELLMKNADVHSKTKKGSTPLHYASLAGQIDSVRELLMKKADVNNKREVCGCIVVCFV